MIPRPYNRSHYFFSRGISDGVPLEKSAPPLESWWRAFVGGLGIVIFMIALFFVLGVR